MIERLKMQIRGHDIAVCSWSLHPKDTGDLVARVNELGLQHVQLALGPLLAMDDAARQSELAPLRSAGIRLTATMISFEAEDYSTIAIIRRTGGFVPDDRWPARRELTLRAAKLTAQLGARFLTTHVGFVPASSDPQYRVMVDRVHDLAHSVAPDGVELLMESGQETASELLQFLNDLNCRNVGVNFDPANMILYGAGDPISAVGILNRHIRHVHAKDAVASGQPMIEWGREVPFGAGDVGVARFLDALDEIDYTGAIAIEREAGEHRMSDIRAAIQALHDAE
jgi:sugar phosphate isomerase/epimerase